MTPREIHREAPLSWRDIADVAKGARLVLSENARRRIGAARLIVEALVEKGIRGYGINTGIGALCDVVVDRAKQTALSHNILMSHACGVGEPLAAEEVRAIIAAQVNNYAHGASGLRLEAVEALSTFLEQDCLPVVPARGSVGYLTHSAAIGLLLIGEGSATCRGVRLSGADALRAIGLKPLTLQAKEGLSLVNGTPCSTGLGCLAAARLADLLDWADAVAALSYECLGNQADVFAEKTLAFRQSQGVQHVGEAMRLRLQGSERLARRAGVRTQDPLSLRAVPQIHGAVRDALDQATIVLDRELASVTDNPTVAGTPDAPQVHSQAHAVPAAVGLALDGLCVAAAELAAVSERRIDRLVNPLISGLPAFLAADGGVCSGFMIAQYTAASLVAENRRLAAPASLDGGITSALQEDILVHATPAALKALQCIDNLGIVLAIELLAAAQAHDLQSALGQAAEGTREVHAAVRSIAPPFLDDRPMTVDIEAVNRMIRTRRASAAQGDPTIATPAAGAGSSFAG